MKKTTKKSTKKTVKKAVKKTAKKTTKKTTKKMMPKSMKAAPSKAKASAKSKSTSAGQKSKSASLALPMIGEMRQMQPTDHSEERKGFSPKNADRQVTGVTKNTSPKRVAGKKPIYPNAHSK